MTFFKRIDAAPGVAEALAMILDWTKGGGEQLCRNHELTTLCQWGGFDLGWVLSSLAFCVNRTGRK